MNNHLDMDIAELEILLSSIRDQEINNAIQQFSQHHGLLDEERTILKNYKNYIPKNEECSICQDKYGFLDEICELPCGHKFHKDCVDKWLENNTTCPMCRHNIREDSGDILKVIFIMTIVRNVFFKIMPYIYHYNLKLKKEKESSEDKQPETWLSYFKNKFIKYFKY